LARIGTFLFDDDGLCCICFSSILLSKCVAGHWRDAVGLKRNQKRGKKKRKNEMIRALDKRKKRGTAGTTKQKYSQTPMRLAFKRA
jgi:hypothetical protein